MLYQVAPRHVNLSVIDASNLVWQPRLRNYLRERTRELGEVGKVRAS